MRIKKFIFKTSPSYFFRDKDEMVNLFGPWLEYQLRTLPTQPSNENI